MPSDAFDFEFGERRGRVAVTCIPSTNSPSIGKSGGSEGFPICTANVDFSGQGYNAFFGWVQFVCSTDNSSGGRDFEVDPLYLFSDSPSPYCFFGLKPTLFDAPSREKKMPLTWLAQSFLAATPLDPELAVDLRNRRVLPLIGFSWGFEIDDKEKCTLLPIKKLAETEWNGRIELLRKGYPTWRF